MFSLAEAEKMKKKLRQILDEGHQQEAPIHPLKLVHEVMGVLGSTDAELRDELGYQALIKLLIEEKLLNTIELKQILEEATSDGMLFHRIGEVETDSVFLRSFSSLLIALILYRDNEEEFLTAADYEQTLEILIDYCQLENDHRGYVEGKGWAHAPAHIADALDECVQSRFFTNERCHMVWTGLNKLLTLAPSVYVSEEDERIANPVIAMIESDKLSMTTLVLSVHDMSKHRISMHTRINIKHFIRCLRVRLQAGNSSTVEMFNDLEQLLNPHFARK